MISPKSYSTGTKCLISDISINGTFEDRATETIKSTFKLSPNYKEVFINNDKNISYDTWIYEGANKEQIVGHKYIHFYPYDKLVANQGDYINWDYYGNGKLTTWLLQSLDTTSQYEVIGKMRLCTNQLRYYDDNGNYIELPCVIDDKLKEVKNREISNQSIMDGWMVVYLQLNEYSAKIKPNQRFLFGNKGNWTAWRITGSGINNYMNLYHDDNDSAKVLQVFLSAHYVNEDVDDLENGIADYYKDKFSVVINTKISGFLTGQTYNMNADVFKDGIITDENVSWTSSDSRVAIIDGNGEVICIGSGSCVITARMIDNEGVYDLVTINVSDTISVNQYEVVISPNKTGVLQGETDIFECHLYENGIKTANVFVFTNATISIPISRYEFNVIDGNTFSIKNIKAYSYENIKIECVSGTYSKDVSICLQSLW